MAVLTAAKVFLILVVLDGGYRADYKKYPMESMEVCQKAVSGSKIVMPNFQGEYKTDTIAMFCANGEEE